MYQYNQSISTLECKSSASDTSIINFLCWNIKKGLNKNWQNDLSDLIEGKDLVVIQEAVLHSDLTEVFDASVHWTFAKGYKSKKHVTGVMTISKHQPIREYQLTCWEPWLATPKCTNITEYALSDTEETLIVVNIHAINFTLGVKQFRIQIEKICKELSKHNGPVILSGDFNTWRKKRKKILDALAFEHGLSALSFQEDHRKAIFGQVLDHVYVRALTPKSTDTYNVQSSDHNPIAAELRFSWSLA